MSQAGALLDTLKKVLKKRSITYSQLAESLAMSEAGIKRIFAQKTVSLQRLEELCEAAQTTMFELIRVAEQVHDEDSYLTVDQEEALAQDFTLLMVFHLVLQRWSFRQILKEYRFDKASLQRLLIQLDDLDLCELHQGNRIRLRVSPRLQWIPDGPVMSAFFLKAKAEFLDHGFHNEHENIVFCTGELSTSSMALLTRRMNSLKRDFLDLQAVDATLDKAETHNYGLILAGRPWVLSDLKDLEN